MKYVIFFYIGGCIRKTEKCFLYKIPTVVYFLLDAVLFVVWIYLDNLNIKVLVIGWNLVLCMIGGISAFVIFQRIAQSVNTEALCAKFGYKHSMTIYLFHQQIIYCIIFLLDGRVNPYLIVLINFIGSITVSSFISIAINRFPITRFLTTGR